MYFKGFQKRKHDEKCSFMLFNTNHVTVPYFPIKVIYDKGIVFSYHFVHIMSYKFLLEENNLG